MNAHQRIEDLQHRLAGPLPGDEAKRAMLPRLRSLQPPNGEAEDLRDASVLVLLFPCENDLVLPLMRRRKVQGDVHSGQISLPGGGRELGESLVETALREAQEELGIDPDQVEVLGPLSPQWIPVSGYRVHPFVATTAERPVYVPDPIEVDRVIETTIDTLLDESRREIRSLDLAGTPTPIPGWSLPEGFLWGATAMILAELLALSPRPGRPDRRSST